MESLLNFETELGKRIDHCSSVEILYFLRELATSYHNDLTKLNNIYENDKKTLQERNQAVINALKTNYSIKYEKIDEEHRGEKAKNEKKAQDAFNSIDIDLSKKKLAIEAKKRDALAEHKNQIELIELDEKKVFMNLFAISRTKLQEKKHQEKVKYEKVVASLDEEILKQENLAANLKKKFENELNVANEQLKPFEIEKLAAKKSFDEKRKAEDENNLAESKKLHDDFMQKKKDKDESCRAKLNKFLNASYVHAYLNDIRSTVPSAINFTTTKDIPDFVCLGDVSLPLGEKIASEVNKMLKEEAGEIIEIDENHQAFASLPYCQRLEDGISMFLSYSPSERERSRYQGLLKIIIMKLFMVFPPGKLEVTMIDPLELGETFAMFTKLGEEQSRIIDTKVWSQEKDISECINILRHKLETITQDYGDDKEKRLKREPLRVLAITDFPTGFSQSALSDLQAIVRKSASCGVCVFIWANSDEIGKLQTLQQSTFIEIKNMLKVATVSNNQLILSIPEFGDVILALDEMKAARENKDRIIETLAKGIRSSQLKIERFTEMYEGIEDNNNWFAKDSIDELAIPIGIKGAGTIVRLSMGRTEGSTAHHALIAGQVGSGKSTLLHTIIMGTLLNYAPDEAQLYLVDFKEGVEFKTYSNLNLPSIKVVAIDCEREFGLNVLKELQKEMKRRFDMFKREEDREEISAYRKKSRNKIPKILVIFDEVQELFRSSGNDNITNECAKLLGELLTLGRAAGIHIILASQNFNLIPSIKPVLFAHSAIRIAINGSEDSAASVLGEGNQGAKQLPDGVAGAAVFNDTGGKDTANVIFQIASLDKELRSELLNALSAIQNTSEYRRKYNQKTRILLTSAEDDRFNVFNQLIIENSFSSLDQDEKNYCLTIGDGFEFNRKLKIGISLKNRSNLLIIGRDEKHAAAIFYLTILSLLYGELGNEKAQKDNQLILLIDLSIEEEYDDDGDTNFRHLVSLFGKQLKRGTMSQMDNMIKDAYGKLEKRRAKKEDPAERLFLLFFGVDRAHKLNAAGMYDDNDDNDKSPLAKLDDIMRYGANYGINCIFWGESLLAVSKILNVNIERDFAMRIAFATDKDTMGQLVKEYHGDDLRPTTAIYMNVDEDIKNRHFRPYETPTRIWIENFARAYHKIIEKP